MRQKYKLLHWDYGTNRGVATDGTRFDGELITFEVRQADLEPEQDGHLIMGEVFSAYEDSAGDHHLYDILIEEGPRAISMPIHQNPISAIDDEQAAQLGDATGEPYTRTERTVVEYRRASDKTLEQRVAILENQIAELRRWGNIEDNLENK
jgi:hypothetical protein